MTCLNDIVNREDSVPLIGREKELERLMLVLCRKEKKSYAAEPEDGWPGFAVKRGFAA